MSVQAITWALGVRVRSATHKAVLLVLANRMDPTGFGWPSQKLVAEESQCCERTVRKVLADLENDGVLMRSDRRRQDGSYSTDAVQFAMPLGGPAAGFAGDPAAGFAGGPAAGFAGGDVEVVSVEIQGLDPVQPAAGFACDKNAPAANPAGLTSFEPNTKSKGVCSRLAPTPNLPEALASYNEAADRCGWVRCREFTESRRGAARAAWKRLGGQKGWAALIAAAERQSFLGGANERGWRMDFDFILKPRNAARVLEGAYLTAAERAAEPNAKELERRLWLLREHGASVWQRSWGPIPPIPTKEG